MESETGPDGAGTAPGGSDAEQGLLPGACKGPTCAWSVQIALATYNGEQFLEELLDSLFRQTRRDFQLMVSDDCSTDRTWEIVQRFAALYPGQVRLLPPNPRRVGPRANFARAIDHATADYLLLCDQDDVWLPNKVALTLERMAALEAQQPPGRPLLVHTDLAVVNRHLEVLGSSFCRYSRLDPHRNDLPSLLTVNVVTGCATSVNRALYERARPVPKEALMHDHWLALVAAAVGAIAYVDEATILYRQHGGNAIGAKHSDAANLLRRIAQTLFSDDRRRLMVRYARQAAVLLARYGSEMTDEHRMTTRTLATFWSASGWRRYQMLRQSGLGLGGLVRNAALLFVVMRSPPREVESGDA